MFAAITGHFGRLVAVRVILGSFIIAKAFSAYPVTPLVETPVFNKSQSVAPVYRQASIFCNFVFGSVHKRLGNSTLYIIIQHAV